MPMIDLAEKLRADLLKRDAAAMKRVVEAYQQVYDRVQLDTEALINKIIASGGEMTKGQVQRLAQYKQLMRTIEGEVDDFGVWFKLNTRQEAAALIAKAGQDAKLLMAEALAGDARVLATIQSLNPRVIESLMGFLDSNGELWKYWSRGEAGTQTAAKIAQTIIENIGMGKNPNAWKGALAEAMGSTLTSALRTSRTIQLWSYREANRANYQANNQVVKGWQWLAELDELTCEACIALHGKIFTNEEPMEGHWNCRCTVVPITIFSDTNEIQRGEDWFNQQTPQRQEAILGPGKYEAWKDGKFEFSQLAQHSEDKTFGQMWTATPLKDLVPVEE
jgi:SPP1 gp7 family putative phage head morphogenesis protein